MSDHTHYDHHETLGFSNGFILGTLVGASVVFLLGTKKGKSILKTLTENGFESIAGLKDIMDDDFFGDEEENAPLPSSPPQPIKRFFKGIKK